MKENITPEEKLLRLIRGEKKLKPRVSTSVDSSSPPIELRPQNKPAIFTFTHKYFPPAYSKIIIYLIIAVSFAYLLASLIYPFVGLKKIKLPAVSAEKSKETLVTQKEKLKPYEFYLEGIKKHKIFANPSFEKSSIPSIAGEAESIKDINLVGIISGDNPQAIIEDKKNQKTYYVARGQFVGTFQIEEIQEGKIILNYKGQRFEISM